MGAMEANPSLAADVGSLGRDELAAILHQVADGITVQDRSGKIAYANDAAAKLIGFASADELMRTPAAEVLERFEMFDEHGEPFPLERLPGRAALAGAVSGEELIRYRSRATGEERWSLVRATPIVDGDGSVEFAVNVFNDVTPIRRAAQRQAEALALLDAVLSSAPVGIGFWDRDLRYVRVNDALAEINGLPADEHVGKTLHEVIPALAPQLEPLYRRVLATGESYVHHELTGETPSAPGEARHWLTSYYPVKTPTGEILGMAAIVNEITERRRAEEERARLLEAERAARAEAEAARERLALLAEASNLLASSLEYETTLANVAELMTSRLADWAIVYLIDTGGNLRPIVGRHGDPARDALVRELTDRYPIGLSDANVVAHVLRTGKAALIPELPDDALERIAVSEEHLEMLRRLGLTSVIVVPLVVVGRVIGAIGLALGEGERRFGAADLALAEELALRAAFAIENARLYREAEQRAQASQALTFIGDGVLLVGHDGVVQLWNPAAETITGISRDAVVGHAVSSLHGWEELLARVPVVSPDEPPRAETLPVDLGELELWLSISGVSFAEGTVYAFRDVSDELALEKVRSDFIATVSHELRTPLAAIYGAAVTLQRDDLVLPEERRGDLLGVITAEANRLARIVNDILWASRVDSGTLRVAISRCDPVEIAQSVVDATLVHLPRTLSLSLVAPDALPHVACDPDKLRQVLSNLVDNAVKYSPDGGTIEVRIETAPQAVRFAVADEGIGIPARERERIFEKFYRLDPDLARGVGGTGLGLYISRELVERMGGRIWVDAADGAGSTFYVELPAAELSGEFAGVSAATR
jgi:PAS domain S-box-containing protein